MKERLEKFEDFGRQEGVFEGVEKKERRRINLMKITKVMFVGLISLLFSINSFTNTNSENDFKKYVLEKLEEIKKIDIYNNDTTTKYHNRNEENSKRSSLKKFIIDNFPEKSSELLEKNNESWDAVWKNNISFLDDLEIKYGFNTNLYEFYREEDNKKIKKLMELAIKLKNKKSLSFDQLRKSKEEYETENKKMNDKYTELHDLMGDEYVDYGETCYPRHYYSNLENFQEKWLKFREDEALFYSELENKKDEKIYFGKLFEITKKQNEYFEDIINNIKKSDRYKEEKYIKDKILKFGK